MTELDRYKLFIKADESPHAAKIKEQLESRRKRTKNVLKLFGNKPRYGMSSTEEEQDEGVQGIKPEKIPLNLPQNQEDTSLETVATFNIPLFGEFPIPAPEVIASSVIAAGTASVVSVAGGVALQAVVGQIKKIFKKIFTKVLKKEVKNFQTKKD